MDQFQQYWAQLYIYFLLILDSMIFLISLMLEINGYTFFLNLIYFGVFLKFDKMINYWKCLILFFWFLYKVIKGLQRLNLYISSYYQKHADILNGNFHEFFRNCEMNLFVKLVKFYIYYINLTQHNWYDLNINRVFSL